MTRSNEGALALLSYFFNALHEQDIHYCHWKSTHGLPRALAGKTDLDLLVDRNDAHRFQNILSLCDFRPVISSPRRQFPAIQDYLGMDAQTGRLTHLHIHYRVVLGEEFVKNYYLPLEPAFLNNTRALCGVRVPLPEIEMLGLVLRALVKYRDRDIVKDMLHLGTGGLPPSTLDELHALGAQTTDERLLCAVERYLPFVSPDLFREFLYTIRHTPRAGWTLYRLRRQLRADLAPFRRWSSWQATRIYWNAILQDTPPFNRLPSRSEKRKSPASGGLVLALVGADGAGKSTVVRELTHWLGWRLNVQTFYMGTTRPSRLTKFLGSISSFVGLPYAVCRRAFGDKHFVTRRTAELAQTAQYIRLVGQGRDRYRRYCAGRQKAARGSIVIFDRYPLHNVHLFGRTMDGPRIAALHGDELRGLTRRLVVAEEGWYRKIVPPEHIFLLRVRPEVSLARKPEHAPERIVAKSHALNELAESNTQVTVIDAEKPLEAVLLEIKQRVWNLI